jgi:hypothetical protein
VEDDLADDAHCRAVWTSMRSPVHSSHLARVEPTISSQTTCTPSPPVMPKAGCGKSA